MTTPLIALGVLMLLVLILAIVAKFIPKSGDKNSAVVGDYVSRGVLMTPAEVSFYHVLRSSLSVETYLICPKVRLADIVDVDKGLDKSRRSSAVNRITSKHVDFVLCNPSDITLYAAIELDDASHRGKRQMEKDKFKDETFSASGIPLIRFPAQATYTPADVVGKINAAFGQ